MKAAAEYLTGAELQFDVKRSPPFDLNLDHVTSFAWWLFERYFFKRLTGIQKICDKLPGAVVGEYVVGVWDERFEGLPLTWPAATELRCSRSASSTQACEVSTDRGQTSGFGTKIGRNLIDHYDII